MKVTQEKLPASQIGLEIEITSEMSAQAYEKTLKEFTRNANIPGFRRGKVPRQVLIQRFGATRIKAMVIEELIEESLQKAIEQEKIEALGNFQLKSSFDDLVKQFEPGATLTFSAAVDVPPEVTLTEYQGFTVQAEQIDYEPGRVDEVLESYRDRSATLVPVEGRTAQDKDVAVIDFSGMITPDAEGEEPSEIPGGSGNDFEVTLTPGQFIPGFVEGIIGMSLGETKEISLSFPEDYAQVDLAGKPAVFTVTLKELKEKELPELDDDFAQEVSSFETLAELRQSLEERFQKESSDRTRSNQETALLKELVSRVEVDLPETLIKKEVDYIVTQMAMQFSRQGMDVKQLFTPELVERLRDQSRPEAVERLKRTFALGKIAELEAIKVESSEIDAKVTEFLADYSSEEVDLDRLRSVVEEDLLKEKVFDWLLEHSSVEMVPEGSLKTEEAEEATEAAEAEEVESAETAAAEPATISPDAESVEAPSGAIDVVAETVTETVPVEAEEIAPSPETVSTETVEPSGDTEVASVETPDAEPTTESIPESEVDSDSAEAAIAPPVEPAPKASKSKRGKAKAAESTDTTEAEASEESTTGTTKSKRRSKKATTEETPESNPSTSSEE